MKNIFAIATLLLMARLCIGQDSIPDFVAGQIYVRIGEEHLDALFEYDTISSLGINSSIPGMDTIANLAGIYKVKKTFKRLGIEDENLRRTFTVYFATSYSADDLVSFFSASNMVDYAEKIPYYKSFITPTDQYYQSNQWNLTKISSEDAWDVTKGKKNIKVAVVDDAVLLNHDDLKKKIWVNQKELPSELFNVVAYMTDDIIDVEELLDFYSITSGNINDLYTCTTPPLLFNNLDDDLNGFPDDIFGWDVTMGGDNDPNPPTSATSSLFSHGTHVSGIVGAESSSTGTGTGIASIGWNISIIPIKCKEDASTDNTTTFVVDGLEYAIMAGADVINMSWGSTEYNSTLESLLVLARSNGIILVAAAGNDGTHPTDATLKHYPAAHDEVISVGASDNLDEKASFSCYSNNTEKWIDVMAPGKDIYSCIATNTNSYGYKDGTSMASPLVAGLCGLMKSYCPSCTPDQIESCLYSTCDSMTSEPLYDSFLDSSRVGHGRINAQNAIACLASYNPVASFSTEPQYLCEGMDASLVDESTGFITSWQWSISTSNASLSNPTSQNPELSVNANVGDSIMITLVVYNDSIMDSDTITNTIYITAPTAEIAYPNSPAENCNNNENYFLVQFTNANPPFEVTYSDGLGNIYTLSNIMQNPALINIEPVNDASTTYTITSIHSYQGCSATVFDTITFISEPCDCYSVLVNNHWTIGLNYGIQFEPTNLSSTTGGNSISSSTFDAFEGVSAVSDANGDLLFFCDGEDIYDKSFEKMQNGNNIFGSNSATQGTIILPKSEIDNTSYLLSVRAVEDIPNGSLNETMWYNIIDMDEIGNGATNEPYGAVVEKNISLAPQGAKISEKITSIKHESLANHYWVLTHSNSGDTFYVFLANPDTIVYHHFDQGGSSIPHPIGTLKSNLRGDRVAAAYSVGYIDLFEFDAGTGDLIFINTQSTSYSSYGIEFSPNGGFLYCTQNLESNILRYTITGVGLTSPSQIPISIPFARSLQLTPDHQRILIQNWGNSTLTAISSLEDPNNPMDPQYTASVYNYPYHSLCFPQLVPSNKMDVTITNINDDCDNLCDGSATALALSACEPITYVWNDSLMQNSSTATNLCAGSYTVVATDACGCTNSADVEISSNTITIVDIMVTNTCFGGNTGSIDLTIDANYYPLSYLWSNGETTEDISNLAPDTYTFTVTDSHGCEATGNANVQPYTMFLINPQDPTCHDFMDGMIDISINEGTSPFSYTWNTAATSQDLANLTAGQYSVTVVDATGCTDSATIELQNPPDINISATIQDVSCYGFSDGSISLSVSGNHPPFSYQWLTGETTSTITNLSSNTYWVYVTDNNGCTKDTSFVVGTPPMPRYNLNYSQEICDCSGFAVASDTIENSFEWSTGYIGDSIYDLCAGTYYVTITDIATGCPWVDSVVIEYDTTLLWANMNFNSPTCENINNGGVITQVWGYATTYYVEWPQFGTIDTIIADFSAPTNNYFGWTPEYDSLPVGTYNIIVTSDSGCVYYDTINLEPEYELAFTVNATDYCSDQAKGSASLSIISGTPPYTYLWSNGETGSSVNNLDIGNYSVTVTDSNGCTDTKEFTIENDLEVNIVISDESCPGANDGEIFVEIINTTSQVNSFLLSLDGTYIQPCQICSTTTHTFTNLSPDNEYHIHIGDQDGCAFKDSFIVVEPATFAVESSITVNNCAASDDYTINLNVTGTATPFSFSWSNGASTNPLNVTSPGTYIVTVTDNNSCSITASINVDSVLQVDLLPVPPTCHDFSDGSISAYATHGLPPYTYEWSTGATVDSINNLDIGDYLLTVTDQFGCEVIIPVSLTDIYMMGLQMEAVPPTCPDANGDSILGYIDLEVINGQAPFSYDWNTGATTEDLDSLFSSIYMVTVTGDDGCVVTDSAWLMSPGLHLSFDERGEGCDTLQNTSHNQNGLLSVSVTGGVPPYSFLWCDSTTTDTIAGLEDYEYYSVTVNDANGCAGIDSAYTLSEQTISVPYGWSIWSTYIDIPGDVDDYFESIGLATEIAIMKNWQGLIYWPLFGLNNIPAFEYKEGYQIKMASAQTFVAEGRLVCPEDEVVTIPLGWSILGYLRMAPMNIDDVFFNIASSVSIVKSGTGLIYWPAYALNAIGNMQPGQGYQIKMHNTDTLIYAPNYYEYGTKASNTLSTPDPGIVFPSDADIRTDKFMVIGIPLESWDIPPQYGDEVLVHGEHGQLVGRSLFLGGFTAIVVYGDDMTTLFEEEGLSDGEGFTISSVAQGTKAVRELKVDSWKEGIGTFEHEMVSVVGEKESPMLTLEKESKLFLELYPNPGTGMFNLKVYSTFEGNSKIEIYNFSGQKVYFKNNVQLREGWQEFRINLEKQPSGPYSLRLISDKTVGYTKLINIQ